MPKRSSLAAFVAVIWGLGGAAAAGPQTGAPAPAPAADYRAVINKYCVTCHNDRAKTAGLVLERMDYADLAAGAEVWEKVVRKVRVGMMPPQGAPQPDAGTRRALVSWLTDALDHGAALHPNPGRPLLHRLNRAE
jgi:mono/diheme cytochrome c family protein